MSEPFLAEVKIVGFNFAPRGWAMCDGQILPINQNQSLFSLMGTTFGGDGRTTFGLPELRGRTPIHPGWEGGTGNDIRWGSKAGEESVALATTQIPSHTHQAQASGSTGDIPLPQNPSTGAGHLLASSAPNEIYHAASDLADMRAGTVANTGSGQGHDNMQPYLVVNYVIALQGLFPSRN